MQIQKLAPLALRILLVLLLCLALAWPQIRGLGFGWVASSDVAAVFVVDTSASMDLKAGEKKRIELVKEIIESIRAEFGEDSKLALFDTSEGAEAAWIARPLFEQKLGTLLAKPRVDLWDPRWPRRLNSCARTSPRWERQGRLHSHGSGSLVLG